MARTPAGPRAIGIVRVSERGSREEATEQKAGNFHSPEKQRERIREVCRREGWRLLDLGPYEEINVSGALPLDRRPGLGPAVTAVQIGHAERIVGAYSDRLFRSVETRNAAIRLVEAAGGEIWVADMGRLTNGRALPKVQGNMTTMMDEYYRDLIAEKSRDAVEAAIAAGVAPWSQMPAGYVRDPVTRRLVVNADEAAAVEEAFRMRSGGATVDGVRAFLAGRGIERSMYAVQRLLASRTVRGEIHFGTYPPNLDAHPAIVDEPLWRAVQKVRVPRGPRPKSDHLLARLGVLVCGACRSRMVVGNSHGHVVYRCPIHPRHCERPASIMAHLADDAVTAATRAAIADMSGRASAESKARDAAAAADRAQTELDALIDLLDPLEPAARKRLAGATAKRDAARERADELRGSGAATLTINGDADWDRLTLGERRDLIKAVVRRATVSPGRGTDRISVELVG